MRTTRREFLKKSAFATAGFSLTSMLGHAHAADIPWRSDNPYLSVGNNAPVFRERAVADLQVSGTLPDWLRGVYMRNGPNPKYEPLSYVYPFEGDGMVHALYFEKDRVRYRNRWIETRELRAETRAGKALYGGFERPMQPDEPYLEPGDSRSPFKNAANTNVVAHGGHILALYEGGVAYEITAELETLGPWDYGGALTSMAAHPRTDPANGELHFFSYSIAEPPFLTYFVADARGRIVRTLPIDLPNPTMIHDMVLTENYAVFFDCPVVFDLMDAARTGQILRWKPGVGTRVGLIHRHDPEVAPQWVESASFFMFHFMNGYERQGRVVVDYVEHPRDATGTASGEPSLHRISVDPRTGSADHRALDDRSVEFPRIDPRRTGRPYRYGYAGVAHPDQAAFPAHFHQLVQYDLVSDASRVCDFGTGRYPGEAIFVPKPGSADEGCVLVYVCDLQRERSDLVLLDPDRFDQEPLATVHLPLRVPNGLHGNWVAL